MSSFIAQTIMDAMKRRLVLHHIKDKIAYGHDSTFVWLIAPCRLHDTKSDM